jgi:hypothetical protein
MSLRKVIYIFVLVGVFVFLWRQWEDDQRPILNNKQSKVPVARTQILVHPSPLVKVRKRSSHDRASGSSKLEVMPTHGSSSARPPDSVPFQNYQGFALAYGDVLLGKIEEPSVSGYAAIPTVDFWQSSVIPYHIQASVPEPERILKALAYLSEKTVLEFVPFEDSMKEALVFEPIEEHCFSYVGRVGGTQPVFISAKCDWHHIVHEVLHALGFVHEHSREDRDDFISVHWDHIPGPFRSQFEIMPPSLLAHWQQYPYDMASIMHYGSQLLTPQSSQPSLTRKDGVVISEPKELSPLDIQKINELFNGR